MTGTTIVLGSSRELASELQRRLSDVVIIAGTAAPAGIDEPEWPRLVDDLMWRTLVALQSARTSMLEQGGRIVVVLPTIGLAGASGLTAYTTAVEGIRAMVKSAARQWCSEGIIVNMVAAPLRLFASLQNADAHLSAPASAHDTSLVGSVIESVRFLLRRDIGHVVGDTLIVDGGSVMRP
jgi:3-oxoacyl-[acyl-carrier protein] reductase